MRVVVFRLLEENIEEALLAPKLTTDLSPGFERILEDFIEPRLDFATWVPETPEFLETIRFS